MGNDAIINNDNTNKNMKDKMISYMEQKYNVEFSYVDSYGGSLNGDSGNIFISSDSIPDKKIKVGYYTKDGKTVFTDNYVQLKYEEQTASKIESEMKSIFGEKIYVSYGVTSSVENDFTDKTTFEEFCSSVDSNIGFRVLISPEYDVTQNYDKVTSRISEMIENNRLFCSGKIYFATSQDDFKELAEIATSRLKQMKCLVFSVDEVDNKLNYEWR